jgi:hypothetical protein
MTETETLRTAIRVALAYMAAGAEKNVAEARIALEAALVTPSEHEAASGQKTGQSWHAVRDMTTGQDAMRAELRQWRAELRQCALETAPAQAAVWVLEYLGEPAPAVRDGWQTMETAPRDGTWILITMPDYRVEVGWWHRNAWRYSHEKGYKATPTHWAPLPPPPEHGSGAA